MPAPFKVKAVYEYRSDEPDDLSFETGQIITVIEDDDADWYTGEYTTNDGLKKDGIFPRNFVEKYEPAIPSRPVRAPRKVPQPDPEPQPEPEAESTREVPPTPTVIRQPTPEPSKEVEHDQPEESSQPAPAPAPASKPAPVASPPPQAEKPAPVKKAPPPVVEKPSSFRDRIAAFNKPAAAPVTPFKPPGASGSSFIKKTYVAPPPSRNAYVPPPRDPPPVKAYRREEELENERDRPEPEEPPRQISLAADRSPQDEEEDQPKPTSLKDRIALLQQQQLEQAQRQAESTKKKEKPKRPAKARTESHEAPADVADDGSTLERVSTERPRDPNIDEEQPLSRKSTEAPAVATAAPMPLPSRELVSDTNDADDSGAADTEDSPHDMSTEEDRPKPRPIKSPPMATQQEPVAEEDEEEEEEETEEEEDPEVRRKRELRERMAKMSGGMGMMGMFGAGAAPQPKRAKSQREKPVRDPEPEEQAEPQRAPPVPIMPGMALPGMARPAPPTARDSDDEYVSAEPTPVPTQEDHAEDDYIAQKLSRRSTSQTLPTQDRAPPPPPPDDRSEPPSSPGPRPMPPPPPSAQRGDAPVARDSQYLEHENEVTSPTSAPKPPSLPGRAVPPPPPVQTQQTSEEPRAVPPIPMSPTSPPSRLPPPPPPGPPSRRTTSDSLRPVPQEESEDEVTEYDGDYDTDLAPTAKHKAALRSHTRDSSIEEDTFSDEGVRSPQSSQPRAVPPPIPTTTPREAPPAPPQITTRPRESVDSPRAPPPPIPQSSGHKPRESVDSPRVAPPPVPPGRSPLDEDEDYDPYRNSTYQPSLPTMMASLRRKTGDFDSDYTEESPVSYQASQSIPVERSAPPPPPPTFQPASPPPPPPTFQHAPPPVERSPTVPDMDNMASMTGGLAAPPQSSDMAPSLGRSNTRSRRSADVARPQNDEFIASDIDLAPNSQWYTRENNAPPSLMNRSDVLWEVESSTNQKRGGRQSVSRDVYILYQDYSQTTVNATYDSSEPTHVSFEQTHERPPMAPRKDQLESAHEQFGNSIAKTAERSTGGTVGEGSAAEFVLSLIRPLKAALLPVGTRSYGALVYANLANASTQQFDEIRAGDIITFRNAKFAGHKGGLHQKYSQEAGIGREHVGVVIDWDGTKKKIRVWEQGGQEKGKKSKVRDESYRVGDLKSGEVRVFRVMPRSWVNWGTT